MGRDCVVPNTSCTVFELVSRLVAGKPGRREEFRYCIRHDLRLPRQLNQNFCPGASPSGASVLGDRAAGHCRGHNQPLAAHRRMCRSACRNQYNSLTRAYNYIVMFAAGHHPRPTRSPPHRRRRARTRSRRGEARRYSPSRPRPPPRAAPTRPRTTRCHSSRTWLGVGFRVGVGVGVRGRGRGRVGVGVDSGVGVGAVSLAHRSMAEWFSLSLEPGVGVGVGVLEEPGVERRG